MFSQVIVTDQLIGANGQPLVGVTVTAKLSGIIQNSGAAITNIERTTTTNASGVFNIRLPSNTDQGTTPTGSYYTFTCAAAGLNSEVVIPASVTSPVRLTELPAAPGATGEVLSVFGRTGAVVAGEGDYPLGAYKGKTERTTGAEHEESSTSRTLVTLTIETKTVTRTAVEAVSNGVFVGKAAASVSSAGETILSMTFAVAAGEKWELKVLEGTVEKLYSSSAAF